MGFVLMVWGAEAAGTAWNTLRSKDFSSGNMVQDIQGLRDQVKKNFEADYESSWWTVSSHISTTKYFYVGWVPKRVSVLVQMKSCNGSWINTYSYVPPAFTAWDDMFTDNKNVYWIYNNNVAVRHEGVIRGSNLHGGCSQQRFKVYAWK